MGLGQKKVYKLKIILTNICGYTMKMKKISILICALSGIAIFAFIFYFAVLSSDSTQVETDAFNKNDIEFSVDDKQEEIEYKGIKFSDENNSVILTVDGTLPVVGEFSSEPVDVQFDFLTKEQYNSFKSNIDEIKLYLLNATINNHCKNYSISEFNLKCNKSESIITAPNFGVIAPLESYVVESQKAYSNVFLVVAYDVTNIKKALMTSELTIEYGVYVNGQTSDLHSKLESVIGDFGSDNYVGKYESLLSR